MSIKLAALAHMIESLSADEREEFRRWYARYDADADGRGAASRAAPDAAAAPAPALAEHSADH